MSRIVVLGPQRLVPTLKETLASLGIDGPIATITAGWQEREADDRELDEHLTGRSRNLHLYARTERVFQTDPLFAAAYHERQEALRRIRSACGIRLSHAMDAARELLAARGPVDYLGPERLKAVEAVRAIDDWYLERTGGVHSAFESRWKLLDRAPIAAERRAIEETISQSAAVAIAGGHVAVLLYRMRLFGLAELLAGKTVIAWSAGAMALSERVVLFHDDPPDGAGHPEILDRGLGVAPGAVFLPHARRRLRLEDAGRVSLFARRFAPASIFTLDERARAEWDGTAWAASGEARHFSPDGDVVESAA